MRFFWFGFGFIIGFTALSLSFGAVSKSLNPRRVTHDQVVYREALTEIELPAEKSPHFDLEIARISEKESLYKETLPLSIRKPIKNISRESYQSRQANQSSQTRKKLSRKSNRT